MTDVIAGRFALCDPIARGGSGVVWRAYDRKTGRFCAAKVLQRRDAGDLLRFVREQSVRMSHEHVLTPYSWAAEDAHVVIASELVDGGSVSTLIGDYGPLAEGTVAVMLDQLLLALEQVHGAGLVHRDVKPGNLLLRATGTGPIQLMLSDFGLAIGADDAHLTQTGTVVGTPGYLPPELLRGHVTPVPRHDLYAAGRVASALSVGAQPSQLGVPTDLSALSPGPLRDTVAALGALDSAHRPPTAADARAMLAPALRDTLPRTRSGAAVEIRHQLPPLTDDAIAEAQSDDPAARHTVRLRTAADASYAGTSTTAVAPTNSVAPMAARPGRRRGAVVLSGAAVVVVAAAVAVPLVLTQSGDDGPPTSPATSTPTRTSGGTYEAPDVTINEVCSFTDEGDVRKAGSTTVRCTRRANGDYVWVRA